MRNYHRILSDHLLRLLEYKASKLYQFMIRLMTNLYEIAVWLWTSSYPPYLCSTYLAMFY